MIISKSNRFSKEYIPHSIAHHLCILVIAMDAIFPFAAVILPGMSIWVSLKMCYISDLGNVKMFDFSLHNWVLIYYQHRCEESVIQHLQDASSTHPPWIGANLCKSAYNQFQIPYKYSLLMHCIKIKSRAKSLLNEQYVFVGGNISFLCVLSCTSEEA